MTLRLLPPMLFEEPDKEMLTGFFRHGLHGIHGLVRGTLYLISHASYYFFLITHIAVFCLSYGNIGINYSQNRTPIIVKIVLPAENQLLYLT